MFPYQAIHKPNKYNPFYVPKDWQNTVRLTLTTNDGFEKVPSDECLVEKGAVSWRIKDGFEDRLLKRPRHHKQCEVAQDDPLSLVDENYPCEASGTLENGQEFRETSCETHYISCPPWCKSKSSSVGLLKTNESTVHNRSVSENDFKQEIQIDEGGQAHKEGGTNVEEDDIDDNSMTLQISYPWSQV